MSDEAWVALGALDATVFVAASSIAIGVWSVAMLRAREFPHWLAWLGLLVGGTLVGITLLGRLRLDVHHFGLVVLAQSVWIVGTGIALVRAPRGPSSGGGAMTFDRPPANTVRS